MKRFWAALLTLSLLAGCKAAGKAREEAEKSGAPRELAAAAEIIASRDGGSPKKEEPPVPLHTQESGRAEEPAPPVLSKEKKPAGSYEEARERAKVFLKELEERKKAREKEAQGRAGTADGQPETGGGVDSEVGKRYLALLEKPGTPAERKPEILLRLAEMAFDEESAAMKTAYELGTYVSIRQGEKYPNSIRWYKKLADTYPGSPQALTAFYNLGFLYSEERMPEEAAKAYKEVISRDPKNAYHLEIRMRLGETAFAAGRYREAAAYYVEVVEGRREDYRDKANFKLGWCWYKLENYPAAVEAFSRVLDQEKRASRDLIDETVDVMGKCFVEEGGVEAITDYLAGVTVAKIYGDLLYRKAGDLYADRSRHKEAVAAYAKGIEKYPATDQALEMEKGLVQAMTSLRDIEGVNVRRKKWAVLYGPGSPWDRARGAMFGRERDRMLEEGLRLAALYRHNRAQLGEGGLAETVEIYASYGALYGESSENAYEMAFRRAQALKEAERLKEAADLLGKIASVRERTSHREEASLKRIEILDLLRRKDGSYFNEFIRAHEDFTGLNPGSPVVPKIVFSMAEHLFAAERIPEARAAFTRFASSWPGDPLAPDAVERVSRCFFRENRFEEAETEARKALKAGLAPEIAADALKLVSFSIFKIAEAREKEGKLHSAVEHYSRLAREFPDTEAAQVSLYRGAQHLRTLGKSSESAAVYKELAERYGNSKYALSALTLSSEILSAMGDWKGVADNYEKLHRMDPEGADAEANLMKASVAREKGGDLPAAAALYAEFSGKYKASPKLAETLFREAAIREKLGEGAAAAALYEKTAKTEAPESEEAYRARAALWLAEADLKAFREVRLAGKMEKALKEKETRLAAALQRLADAARFPYPETFAASLYKTGEAFEHMKTAILESELPKGMNEEETEQYRFLLEEKAFPLENRAVDLYRKGIAATRKAGIRNEWVGLMYGRLEVLLPYVYKRTEEPSPVYLAAPYPRAGWVRRGER